MAVITHVTGYFVEGMAYQENLLPAGQGELGHNVFVITGDIDPDYGFNSESRIHCACETHYQNFALIRLKTWTEVKNKGPILRGLFKTIRKIDPDILFIHDVGPSLIVGLLYKFAFGKVRLHFDCHSDFANALKSPLGPIYHGFFRLLFYFFQHKFERLFAVAPSTIDFMHQVYGIPRSKISFLPLPGNQDLLQHKAELYTHVRRQLGIPDHWKILIHTGKMPDDKETLAVLNMFNELGQQDVCLVLAGFVRPEFVDTLNSYISANQRVKFVGWVDSSRLRELFIASDLLVAPGSLSNSFIDAVCAGLPLVLDDTDQGRLLTQNGNGMLVARGDLSNLVETVRSALLPERQDAMRKAATRVACDYDYRAIARASLKGCFYADGPTS